MGLAQKKVKIERDRFTEDGIRLFNPTKEHGVIYCDGFIEARFVQEYNGDSVLYRGDHAPCGYKKGAPMPKSAPELLTENEVLQARIRDLEESQKRTNELLAKLSQQLEASANEKAAEVPQKAEKGSTDPKSK